MCPRSRKPITADESTVVAKAFLNAIMVEDGQGERSFPDSARTYEDNRSEGMILSNQISRHARNSPSAVGGIYLVLWTRTQDTGINQQPELRTSLESSDV